MAAIDFIDVQKHYRQGDRHVRALAGCSLRIAEGEFFSLLGPSGTGKTTLLGLVAGFEHPDAGQVLVGGRPVVRPGPDRAVVFQAPTLFPWHTALDNVAQALRSKGHGRAERRELALAQLREVGLGEAASRHPHQLSGGMQQRVGIARALAMDPQVLLMDEPFAALDAYVRREAQELIVALWLKRRVTTLFVTHSIEEALMVSTKVGIMAGGAVTDVFDVPFDHPRDPTAAAFNDLRRTIQDRIAAGVRAEREPG
jgi:NitT/TauT family transport system ATP-binding protein